MIQGIDVSTYQGTIDFAALKASGRVQFVYAKATEGTGYADDQFARNRKTCALRDIPFGAYHFFRPSLSALEQADWFIQQAHPFEGCLLPMVDVEVTDGCSAADLLTRLAVFTARLEPHLNGKKALIYSYYSFWKDTLGGATDFAGHPFWLAEYASVPAPTLPPGFPDWTIWQYADNGNFPGISGAVDRDVLNPRVSLAALTV